MAKDAPGMRAYRFLSLIAFWANNIHCAPITTCQHSLKVKLDSVKRKVFKAKYNIGFLIVGHCISNICNPANPQNTNVTSIVRIAVWYI